MMHEGPTLFTPTLMSVYSTLQTLDHLRATCMMHGHPSTHRRRHAHCDIWTVTSRQWTHSPSHGQRSPLRPQRGAMHTLASSPRIHTIHTQSQTDQTQPLASRLPLAARRWHDDQAHPWLPRLCHCSALRFPLTLLAVGSWQLGFGNWILPERDSIPPRWPAGGCIPRPEHHPRICLTFRVLVLLVP